MARWPLSSLEIMTLAADSGFAGVANSRRQVLAAISNAIAVRLSMRYKLLEPRQ
jgi:hypothetical protein